MVTKQFPDRPDLAQLRTQARELQRAARAQDPGYPLHAAQRALAQSYGFASWARLRHHVEAINDKTWIFSAYVEGSSPVDSFLRLACLTYTDHPRPAPAAVTGPSAHSIAVAAVCGDVDAVRRFVSEASRCAVDATGPFQWSPLMYLAYGRVATAVSSTLECARILVDGGANPNDGRFFGGFQTPFTVITGVFGGGERGESAHPHALPLGRLLLDRGADPNDAQTVYNRMFTDADDAFELLFEFGLGQSDGGPWHRLLPDLAQTPAEMLAGLLSWAVDHDQRSRVALLARHGVDVTAPVRRDKTPLAIALANGNAELASQLRELGATEPVLNPVELFLAAALAGDSAAVAATPAGVVTAAHEERPSSIVWAAAAGRLEAVRLLVANGFDINAMGRSDVWSAQPWQTALHTAVERDNIQMAQLLLSLGADTSLRDNRFDGTALDWAEHLGRPELAALLVAANA